MNRSDRILIARMTNTFPPDLADELDELARLSVALGDVGDADPTPEEATTCDRIASRMRERLKLVSKMADWGLDK